MMWEISLDRVFNLKRLHQLSQTHWEKQRDSMYCYWKSSSVKQRVFDPSMISIDIRF